MDFSAVASRSLSDAVFEQLRDRILSGDLPPGTALPSERALCEQLGVNRAALREALKRLQQLRLVVVKQGESTRVLDPIENGSLEILVSMVFDRRGQLRPEVIRSFIELRTAVGPDIARLAAARRTAEQLAALEESVERMAGLDPDDVVSLEREHMALWRTLVRASGNLAYQLMFNTMNEMWQNVQELGAHIIAEEVRDLAAYRALVGAVERRSPADAAAVATKLVATGSEAMLAAVAALAGDTEVAP